MIVNWLRYNIPNNLNTIKCVVKELKSVKSNQFIEVLHSIASQLVVNNELTMEQFTLIFKGLGRGLQGATQDLGSKEEKEKKKKKKKKK